MKKNPFIFLSKGQYFINDWVMYVNKVTGKAFPVKLLADKGESYTLTRCVGYGYKPFNANAKNTKFLKLSEELFKEVPMIVGSDGGITYPEFTDFTKTFVGSTLNLVCISHDQDKDEEFRDGNIVFVFDHPDGSGDELFLHPAQCVYNVSDILAYASSAEDAAAKAQEILRGKVKKLAEAKEGVTICLGKEKLGKPYQTIKEANKTLDDSANLGAQASYIVVGSSSNFLMKSGPCHGSICHNLRKRHYIISRIQENYNNKPLKFNDWKNNEAVHDWIDFLVNRSPFRDACIRKDINEIINHGYVFDARIPANAMSTLCIATRHMWGFPIRLHAFSALRKLVPPELERLAWFASLHASGKIDDGVMTELSFKDGIDTYTALPHFRMTDLGVAHWFFGKVAKPNESFVTASSYASPHRQWETFEPSDENVMSGKSVNNKLSEKLINMPVKKKGTNKFDVGTSSVSDALEYAAEAIIKYSEDLGLVTYEESVSC